MARDGDGSRADRAGRSPGGQIRRTRDRTGPHRGATTGATPWSLRASSPAGDVPRLPSALVATRGGGASQFYRAGGRTSHGRRQTIRVHRRFTHVRHQNHPRAPPVCSRAPSNHPRAPPVCSRAPSNHPACAAGLLACAIKPSASATGLLACAIKPSASATGLLAAAVKPSACAAGLLTAAVKPSAGVAGLLAGVSGRRGGGRAGLRTRHARSGD